MGNRRTAIPQTAVDAARELRAFPGVVCVVWGSRKTSGRWYKKPCLSVHVVKKHPRTNLGRRLLPKELNGHRIDVLEVGRPKLHVLDVSALVKAVPGSRKSTITALALDGDDAIALLSGHGVLGASSVTITDGSEAIASGIEAGFAGEGSSVDWALGRCEGGGQEVDTRHRAAGCEPPFPFADGDFPNDTPVMHYSTRRGGLVYGKLQGEVIQEVTIGGSLYTQLLAVRPTDGMPFSMERDSGSLVVRKDDRVAVGAIVAGPNDSNPAAAVYPTYIYDVRRLASAMGSTDFDRFFVWEGA